ncbi:hypothetical protein EJJ20_29955 [Pseudomonas poae]|nr:hypothetical protein EJJ20_29955 [Pseudomonas poae]
MTTNQTIDGVPRELLQRWLDNAEFFNHLDGMSMSSIDAARKDDEKILEELRALMDRDKVNNRKMGLVQFFEAHPIKPATQLQGEPVAYDPAKENKQFEAWARTQSQVELRLCDIGLYYERQTGLAHDAWQHRAKLYADQPAPVAVVPDGYCIMPRQLTAENGAKALLLGEFKLLVTKECPECCELEEPVEGCSICDGEGEYGQKHTIPWDQIKFIYSKAVSGLAVNSEPAKSR